jgi:hypothetical protein
VRFVGSLGSGAFDAGWVVRLRWIRSAACYLLLLPSSWNLTGSSNILTWSLTPATWGQMNTCTHTGRSERKLAPSLPPARTTVEARQRTHVCTRACAARCTSRPPWRQQTLAEAEARAPVGSGLRARSARLTQFNHGHGRARMPWGDGGPRLLAPVGACAARP